MFRLLVKVMKEYKMSKFPYILLMLVLLSACGSNKSLLQLNSEIVGNNHTFTASKADGIIPAFYEDSIGAFMLHSAASFFAASAGSAYQPAYQEPVADTEKQNLVRPMNPAKKILAEIQPDITRQLSWKKTEGEADYIVNVTTEEWGIKHHPIKVASYAVVYRALLWISENPKRTKAESPKYTTFLCGYKSEQGYSKDDVYKDNGSVLKKELAAAAKACSAQFSGRLTEEIKRSGLK